MKKITLLHCLLLLATSAFAQTTTQVSTYAGTGTYGRDNGPTLTASFGSPDGICSDQSGNLYIVEQGNDLVRKITPNGDVSTFAGSGIQGDDDGLGVKASFNRLQGICIDNSGNLYVMDRIRISKITPAGEVSTIVRKRSGYQDGPVSVAKIGDFQGGICIDNQGNLFVGELHKHRIRKITPQGIVSTFAGAMDGTSGNTNGTGTDARFTNPSGICADASNNIYVCDYGNNLIRKITSAGEVSTFAGNGSKNHSDGTNLNAGIPSPWGICIDASGDFYLTQNDYHVSIRKISNTGSVTTYAGNGKRGITNGIGSEASFLTLNGICKNGAGEIYVTDMFYCIIRKIVDITPTPPVVTYVDLPVTVCLGSTVDQPATTNGSSAGFVVENLVHPFNNALSICNNENNVFVLYQSFDQFSNSIDSVKRYDFQGNILDSFELLGSLNELIAVDNSGRIYGVYPDANNPSVSNIQRFNSDGSLDFSFSIPSYILGKILAIELGPDGFLYATEEGTGYIRQIDVSSGTVNNLPDPSPSFSFDRIVDIAFDKAGDMILADIGLNKILKRNKSDNNYYPMNVGFDTLFPNTTSISIDTVGFGHITVSSNTSSFPVSIFYGVEPFDVVDSIIFNSQLNVINPKLTLAIGGNSTTGSLPTVWALDSINNQVKVTTAGYYSITPQLPQGISFNFATGAFYGTATAPSPLTNYTITVNNSFGTTTSNVAFEVAPAAGLSNGAGTTSALSNIKDGLSINMFSPDNCSKLIGIEDAAGGTELGKVQVKQTVSAIAVFNDAFFVGRVNEINAQNNNAAAVLRLFFSYQDIENYNASNGTGIDLINDTLSDMEVAVLQLHTDDRGHIEQIKHTITATWELADHHWKAEFPIDKLSKFYMGEVTSIENFNCAESDHDTVVTSAAFYVWEGDSLFTSGDYTDTLVNMNGCDSILNLNITINGGAGLVALSAFEQGISIYPNPSKGMVTIKLQGEINVESLMVFNVYGQEVYSSSNLNPTSVLDLSTIPKGIYFIQLANEDVKTVRRLVLN